MNIQSGINQVEDDQHFIWSVDVTPIEGEEHCGALFTAEFDQSIIDNAGPEYVMKRWAQAMVSWVLASERPARWGSRKQPELAMEDQRWKGKMRLFWSAEQSETPEQVATVVGEPLPEGVWPV